MKKWILIMSLMSSVVGQQALAHRNCQWTNDSGNNFHAEDTLSNLESCSLFIRSQLLNGGLGILGSGFDPAGTKIDGTLIFKAPNGDEKRCDVLAKKKTPDVLSPYEMMVGYLRAELMGEALSAEDQVKAQDQLQRLEQAGFSESSVLQKVDENLEIICHGPIS